MDEVMMRYRSIVLSGLALALSLNLAPFSFGQGRGGQGQGRGGQGRGPAPSRWRIAIPSGFTSSRQAELTVSGPFIWTAGLIRQTLPPVIAGTPSDVGTAIR